MEDRRDHELRDWMERKGGRRIERVLRGEHSKWEEEVVVVKRKLGEGCQVKK